MRLVRKVVDSNFLRNPALGDYLGRSRGNIAVLTEFVLLEAHKQNPLVTVPNSIAILARSPGQVAILRPSRHLSGFPGRSAGLQKRLIDQHQSRAFPGFCRQVGEAAAGDAIAAEAILRTAATAQTHIDGLIEATPSVIEHFQHHVRRFTPDELAALRTRQPRSWELQRRLFDIVFESAGDVARAANALPSRFRPEEVVNLPVFRYCLCMALLLIRWVEKGRPTQARDARIANDVIDANIAAYSAYFDGVLSGDALLCGLHAEARHILREIGGAVPG
jgi:hypothetical protein